MSIIGQGSARSDERTTMEMGGGILARPAAQSACDIWMWHH